jgi:hypothetical protein
MALAWAVEPSAFKVPLEQVGVVAAAALVEAELLLEPPAFFVLSDDPALLLQAANAVMATSTPTAWPARVSFTIDSPSSIGVPIATLGAGCGGSGEPW